MDLAQVFASQIWHDAIICRVTNRKHAKGSFAFRSSQELGQEPHWAGCVSECCQTHVMYCRNKETGADANRLLDVIVVLSLAVFTYAITLLKHDHDPGRCLQERLPPVST